MEDLRAKVKEQEILLSEKDKNLKKLDEQHQDAISNNAKLKAEYDSLEIKFEQAKTLHEELKARLGSVEKEYVEFKSQEEPVRAQNESIRLIMNSNEQGKIFLALAEAHPKSMTIDEIADLIDSTAVMIKSSLLSLEELNVINFNPATREVKLQD